MNIMIYKNFRDDHLDYPYYVNTNLTDKLFNAM